MNTSTSQRRRSSIEDLYQQSRYFADRWPLQQFADAVTEFMCVMNGHNEIVFSNTPLVHHLELAHGDELIGRKFGDIFQCTNAVKSPGGCGTTESCKMCGAFQAMQESKQGSVVEKECRIVCEPDASGLELSVRATPLAVNGMHFTIVSATDISSAKRKKILESVFFHDVMNVVGGLQGYSELLKEATPDEMIHFGSIINGLALELADQIEAQRELSLAEHNEMNVTKEILHSQTLLQSITTTYKRHPAAAKKHIRIDPQSEDFIFTGDEKLMKRILGNLTKNALEAVSEGSIVTLGCKRLDSDVRFWVHNHSTMERKVQLQVFQRSFTTKGEGRGLGTYAVKLFTERYLGGKASFVSNKDDGTIFTVTVPFLSIVQQPEVVPPQREVFQSTVN